MRDVSPGGATWPPVRPRSSSTRTRPRRSRPQLGRVPNAAASNRGAWSPLHAAIWHRRERISHRRHAVQHERSGLRHSRAAAARRGSAVSHVRAPPRESPRAGPPSRAAVASRRHMTHEPRAAVRASRDPVLERPTVFRSLRRVARKHCAPAHARVTAVRRWRAPDEHVRGAMPPSRCIVSECRRALDEYRERAAEVGVAIARSAATIQERPPNVSSARRAIYER